MRVAVILLCLAAVFRQAAAQVPVLWSYEYEYSGWDWPTPSAAMQTLDGGYVTVGTAQNYTPFILKVDGVGSYQWDRVNYMAGPVHAHRIFDVAEAPDCTYTIVGTEFASPDGLRHWKVARLDPLGQTLWSLIVTHVQTNGDPASIARCSDGSYIISGSEYCSAMRIGPAGDTRFERTYGAGLIEMFEHGDGGFVGAGTVASDSPDADCYFVHTYSNGVLDWDRAYIFPGRQLSRSLVAVPTGGFVIAARDSSAESAPGWDILLLRIANNGDTLWTHRYDFGSTDDIAGLQLTADNNLALLAKTQWQDRLMKLTLDGDSLWTNDAIGAKFAAANDSGYLLAYTASVTLGLIKLGSSFDPIPVQRLTMVEDSGTVRLIWQPVIEAIGYRLFSSDQADGPYGLERPDTLVGTSVFLGPSATRKFYYVTAVRP